MSFFSKKNKKKEEKIEDSQPYSEMESDLIVHNMPSQERLNREISNKKLLGDISIKGGDSNSQAKKQSKIIGIVIMSVGVVVIAVIGFLTYKFVISPTAKDGEIANTTTNEDIEKTEGDKNKDDEDVNSENKNEKDEEINISDPANVVEGNENDNNASENKDENDEELRQEEFPGVDAEDLLPLTDSDGDGLYDEEELVLDTSIHLADSDGDGHGDLVEIRNSYNPLGDGFLSEASSLSVYRDDKQGFSLIHPKKWEIKKSNETLFVIHPGDGSVIQLSVEANYENLGILNWYKNSFSNLEISNEQLIENDLYDGVISEDSLYVYLTDKKKEKIFTFSYIPISEGRLAHINIFEMIYSSLAK